MGNNTKTAQSAQAKQTINAKTTTDNGSKTAETMEEAAAILAKTFKPETEAAPKLQLISSAIVPPIHPIGEAEPMETDTETKTETGTTEAAAPAEAKTKEAEPDKATKETTQEKPQPSPDLFSAPAEPAPKPLTFAEIQAKISAELSRLKQQQERAAKRETLVNCKNQMKEYSEKLAQNEKFEAEFCRLSFQTLGEEYNSRQTFKDSFLISNPAILRKFCDILAEEVSHKITEIETEIING